MAITDNNWTVVPKSHQLVLNRSHPLAGGLIMDLPLNEAGGDVFDVVSRWRGSFNTSAYDGKWGKGLGGVYAFDNNTTGVWQFQRPISDFMTDKMTVLTVFRADFAVANAEFVGEKTGTVSRNWVFGVDSVNAKTICWVSGTFKFGEAYTIGDWHAAGFTYDGANITHYIDDIVGTPSAKTGNIQTSSGWDFEIGRIGGGVNPRVQIARVSIWNRALSGDEVRIWQYDPYGMYVVSNAKPYFMYGNTWWLGPREPDAPGQTLPTLTNLNTRGLVPQTNLIDDSGSKIHVPFPMELNSNGSFFSYSESIKSEFGFLLAFQRGSRIFLNNYGSSIETNLTQDSLADKEYLTLVLATIRSELKQWIRNYEIVKLEVFYESGKTDLQPVSNPNVVARVNVEFKNKNSGTSGDTTEVGFEILGSSS